jgi:hypothetical protein
MQSGQFLQGKFKAVKELAAWLTGVGAAVVIIATIASNQTRQEIANEKRDANDSLIMRELSSLRTDVAAIDNTTSELLRTVTTVSGAINVIDRSYSDHLLFEQKVDELLRYLKMQRANAAADTLPWPKVKVNIKKINK